MPRPRAGGTAHPFGGLAALRGRLSGGKKKAGPARNPENATPAADDERRLFHAAVGDVKPLAADNRAEIERPRPPPQPRPRSHPDDAAAPEAAAAARDDDPLRAAYAGVIPLRDSGRALLDHAPRRIETAGDSAREGGPLPPLAAFTDPADLFRHVVRDAVPLARGERAELRRPAPEPAPLKHEADNRAVLDESLAAPLSLEDRLDTGDEAAFLRPGLPRRVLSDLRRGRWMLQGEIDLHGFTREEARQALADFLALSLQQGRRCIRVIHGKGLGSPGRIAVLKQLSRGWLAQREEILAFCQAGPHDGGGGALLVLMRAQNIARR